MSNTERSLTERWTFATESMLDKKKTLFRVKSDETGPKMKSKASFTFLVLLYLILDDNFDNVETLEPVTTSVAVGTAIVSSVFLAGYTTLKCQFYECCGDPWVKPNMTGMYPVNTN